LIAPWRVELLAANRRQPLAPAAPAARLAAVAAAAALKRKQRVFAIIKDKHA